MKTDLELDADLLVVVMYARLGRPLLVHHFDASSRDAVLLMCNCSTYYPGATGHSDNRSRITARSVLAAQNIPDWQPITPVPFVTIPMQHPSMTVPITVGQMHMYTTSAAYYPTMPAMTAPAAPPMTNEHGLPVNIANGVVRTESRGVHISGLVWGVSENDIRELVRPYGRPQAVEVKRSSATIRFGSVEEARQVIERLDQIRFHERRITVKEDRESTPVQDPGMLIVNGNPQRVSRAQAMGNSRPARKLTCIWRRHIARQGDERANGQAGRGGQWRGGGIGAGQVGGAYGVVFPGRLICVLRCFEMYDC